MLKAEKKIKIAYLCTGNPTDRKIWSGTFFNMHEALEKQDFEIEWIEVGKYKNSEQRLFSLIENFYKKLFNRGFNQNHFLLKAYVASQRLSSKLKNSSADIIFAPTYIAELAFVTTEKPIVYLNDATFHQLLNYYGGMSGFGFVSKKLTALVEKLALKKADVLVFSSNWAANHAVNFYQIRPEKVKIIKFGSNSAAPEKIILKNYQREITFLFLGIDWNRKGGQIALDTVKILNERNFSVKLLVVGCAPPVTDQFMDVFSFLNKNNPAEAQQILDILSSAHFVFMPTRADCTPISFCEAASYGLPVISTDTGGVSAVVENGKTGILLPISATAKAYADQIEILLNSSQKIEMMAKNARIKYDEELNWKVWGDKMKEVIVNLLSEK